MSIKNYITQAIQGIESEKQQKIDEIRQKVLAEKILPYNQEVDSVRDKAIQEKRNQAEKDIEEIKQRYNLEKQEIEEAAAEDKKKNEISVINQEAYLIQQEYEPVLAKLRSQVED